jgi:hypothetical protein
MKVYAKFQMIGSRMVDGTWDDDGMQDLSISPQIELEFPR